jgi:hypothetical protein
MSRLRRPNETMTNPGARHSAIWVAALVALLAVVAIPSFASNASAASVVPATNANQQWAYGASEWQNTSVHFGNGSLGVKAYFAWTVIYTRTNISTTTHAWEVQKTETGDLFGEFCSANCSNSSSTRGNLSLTGWEQVTAFFNTTSNSTVLLNGTPVAAYGITNESFRAAGNLTESSSWSWVGFTGSPQATSTYFSLAITGHHAIAFQPALGILPKNVTAGDNWTSSANYTASGAWNATAILAHTGLGGHQSVARPTYNGSLALSGGLTLFGADLGTITLRNGQVDQVIVLGTNGPFFLHEGVIFLPGVLDLFSVGGSHPWDSDAQGMASLRSDRIDVAPGDGALGITASSSGYAGAASALAPGGPAAIAPAASSTPSGELQAQPESVAQAQSAASCMVGHCGSPVGSSPAGGALFLGVVVVVVVALVVGAFGVVEYRSWAKRTYRSKNLVGPLPDAWQHPVAPGAVLTAPVRPAEGGSVPPPTEGPMSPPRMPPQGPAFPPR